MNDRVLQVRQIAQYKRVDAAIPGTLVLLQYGDIGSPYASILASDLVTSALAASGDINLSAANGAINFLYDQGAGSLTLSVENGELLVRPAIRTSTLNAAFVNASGVVVNGDPVVTVSQLAADRAASVTSFNFRSGDVMLMEDDIKRAGGAPIRDAHFGGWITAPSVWDTRANDDTVATTNWVHRAIHDTGVSSFNGRSGDITLTTADISAATAAGPGYPTAPSPPLGDASNRIATTLFVDESLQDLHLTITDEQLALLMTTYAPINSPQLTGIPTAPTANPGTHTGQLATTAFVMNAVSAATSGVSSFNTRTGAVLLNTADITGAGGAILASPAFSGTPTAPTAAPGTSTIQLATTAFVGAAVTAAGGVTSFNTRTGAVTLSLADVTGTGVLSNTALAGIPTAPTAAPGTSTTQVATTAFVAASAAAGVTSFMSRTGAVTLTAADVSSAGGALNASPVFTGTPTAPTAAPGTSTTQLATTAFVAAAMAAGGGVTTFNGRAGAVTLTTADVTGAGGAPIASPTFTGTPAAPTATVGTSTTQVATTAFVQAALPGATPGWTFALNSGVSTQTATGAGAILNTSPGANTWNPADNSGMTLSNGNLTATCAAAGGVRALAPARTGGKYYFEIQVTPWGTSGNTWVGLATGTANLGTPGANAALLLQAGQINIAGSNVGNIGARSSGDIIGIAVDLSSNNIWFRVSPSGLWNASGTANPATNTGGLSVSALAAPLYPYFNSNNGGNAATVNFGMSAFSGVVPSGFSAIGASDLLKITNKNNGGIAQIQDNTSESSSPANYLLFMNNITGQPSIISTIGTDTNRGIQLVPSGTGTVQVPTMASSDSSTAAASTAFVHAVAGVPVVRSYLAGLTLSTAGSSATFAVSAGVAADSTNAQMMTLASALSKTTAAWAVGNNNGALDTGAIANSTWYHVFLIERTDLTVVDVLVSLSATAPTMPANYTFFRRIGSMKTNASGQWTKFLQVGDFFEWDVGLQEINNGTVPTTAANVTLAGVPTGIKVRANLSGYGGGGGIASAWDPDITGGAATNPFFFGSAATNNSFWFTQTTNVSAQIRWLAGAAVTIITMYTTGWTDRRGRDA